MWSSDWLFKVRSLTPSAEITRLRHVVYDTSPGTDTVLGTRSRNTRTEQSASFSVPPGLYDDDTWDVQVLRSP